MGQRFEDLFLPHLNAAYSLARFIVRDLPQISKPWWDYDLAAIEKVEKQSSILDENDLVALMTKHATLDPSEWFALGTHLRKEGQADAAAQADEKGFELDDDAVGMSNEVGPLVDYYFDHGRKDDAERVAKAAADVFSNCGLQIYALLLEKEGGKSGVWRRD